MSLPRGERTTTIAWLWMGGYNPRIGCYDSTFLKYHEPGVGGDWSFFDEMLEDPRVTISSVKVQL